MKTKLVALVLSLLILSVFVMSCSVPSETPDTEAETSIEAETDTYVDTESETESDNEVSLDTEPLIPSCLGSDIKKYEGFLSSVKISLESDRYQITNRPNDSIKIIISANNDEEYTLWNFCTIQRLDEETGWWETLQYIPLDYYDEVNSSTVLVKDGGNTTYLYFYPYYVTDELTPGTYRLLVFIKAYTFVSPEFTMYE